MSTSTTSRTEGQEREYRHLVENSAMHGVKLALDKVKVDSEGWQRVLVYGGEIRTAVAETIVAKTRELALGSVSQEHAREIMGRNFFGVEEAMRHFGVLPAKQQIAALNKFRSARKRLRPARIRTSSLPCSRCQSSISVARLLGASSSTAMRRSGTANRRSPRTGVRSAGTWSAMP